MCNNFSILIKAGFLGSLCRRYKLLLCSSFFVINALYLYVYFVLICHFLGFTEEESKQLLIQALTEVLLDLSSTGRYTVLSIERDQTGTTDNSFQQSTSGEQSETGETSPKRPRLDQESFHTKLR